MISVNTSFHFLAEQIAQIASTVRQSFYQRERLYVLPYLPQKSKNRSIHFPRIAGFTNMLTTYKPFDLLSELPSETIATIQEFVSRDMQKYTESINNYCLFTKSLLDVVESKLKNVFERELNIVISPSVYGSIGSYDIEHETVILFPRVDLEPQKILYLGVNALVHVYEFNSADLGGDHAAWRNKQNRVKEVIAKHDLAISSVEYIEYTQSIENKTIGSYAHESAKYLKELGYPINSYITSAEQIPNLSKSEFLVLNEFLDHRTLVVSFGRIAELLWGNESGTKYSLYAISKAIQRIRDKISSSGIHQNLIHCDRRKGYVLYD